MAVAEGKILRLAACAGFKIFSPNGAANSMSRSVSQMLYKDTRGRLERDAIGLNRHSAPSICFNA